MQSVKRWWAQCKLANTKMDWIADSIILIALIACIVSAIMHPTLINIVGNAAWGILAIFLIAYSAHARLYQKTAPIRQLGLAVMKQAHAHTFVRVTRNTEGIYHLEPIGAPDDETPGVYSDEIVIRCGIDPDGEPITAYYVSDGLQFRDAVGLLETTKLHLVQDTMEDN